MSKQNASMVTDLTGGSVTKLLLTFAFPLFISNALQAVYNIVGSTESDPLKGKISDESPIGKALIGAKAGDVVSVEAPAGTITIEILEINK